MILKFLKDLVQCCTLWHLLPSRSQGFPLKARWLTKHLWLFLLLFLCCRSHLWHRSKIKSISWFHLWSFLFALSMSLFHMLVDDFSQYLYRICRGKPFFWTSQDPSWMRNFYYIYLFYFSLIELQLRIDQIDRNYVISQNSESDNFYFKKEKEIVLPDFKQTWRSRNQFMSNENSSILERYYTSFRNIRGWRFW